jgi:hypothetical protein
MGYCANGRKDRVTRRQGGSNSGRVAPVEKRTTRRGWSPALRSQRRRPTRSSACGASVEGVIFLPAVCARHRSAVNSHSLTDGAFKLKLALVTQA